MAQNWNLQDIKPAPSRKRRTTETPSRTQEQPEKTASRRPQRTRTSNSTKKPKIFVYAGIAALIILVGSIVVSFLLGGAEVTIYPKNRQPTVNTTATAYLTPPAQSLGYEVMTLEAEGERQVTATGQEEVSIQAEGSITIYNAHSADSIRLVTNTRFESPDGLIFKIKDSAVVPGYTTDASGKKLPGSITAEVYADEVGEQYNIGPSKFTIPGFAGDPEFENIYAESRESFSGGFDGMRFVVDEDELETAQQSLHAELRNSLLERITAEKPAGFVVFSSSVTFSYQSLPAVDTGENLATIKERVSLHVPLFEEAAFARFIALSTIPGYEGENVRIEDFSSFDFAYAQTSSSTPSVAAAEEITFTLAGKPQVIWEYDAQQLKIDLVGKSKTALQAILGAYPAIEKAKASTKPFWKSSFPDDPEDITITEVLEDPSQE